MAETGLTTDTLILDILAERNDVSLLCIGPCTGFRAVSLHQGRMAMVAPRAPATWAAADFTFLRTGSGLKTTDALRQLIARGQTFDVILVDDDHRLPALYDQIELALTLAHPGSLFLFDDAVPPDCAMASPEPRSGWWTGQVCWLRQLLRPLGSDSVLDCLALPPTGLLLARNFALPPRSEVEALRHSAPATNDELAALTRPADPQPLLAQLHGWLDGIATSTLMTVIPDEDALAQSRSTVDPPLGIERRPPLFVVSARQDGSLPPEAANLSAGRRQLHERRLYTYEDVLLHGFDHILRDNRVALRHFDPDIARRQLSSVAAQHGRYGNANTQFRLYNGRVVVERARLVPTVRLGGHVLLATADEPMNYGMWLLMVLPTVQEFLRNRDRYDRLLCHCPAPWQKDMLRVAGVDMADVIEHDTTVTYDCARISLFRYSRRDLWAPDSVRAALAAIGPPPETSGRRVFLSRLGRTRAGAYRGLMTEEPLIAGMRDLGFEISEPETLGFAQQIQLFRETSVLVGLGGAAMFNAVFCPPGSKVMTIESGPVFVDAHCNIFASSGHSYAVVFGEEDPTDERPLQKRWRVDVPRTLAAVSALVAGTPPPLDRAMADTPA